MLPGTDDGWVEPGILDGWLEPGIDDGCVVVVPLPVPGDVVVCANAAVEPISVNAMILNFIRFMISKFVVNYFKVI